MVHPNSPLEYFLIHCFRFESLLEDRQRRWACEFLSHQLINKYIYKQLEGFVHTTHAI